MKATVLAALSDDERFMVAQTEADALAVLDEDAVLELHQRIRRARNKYVGQYRRGASERVTKKRARGAARPANRRAALRAEAFEQALARVSRRLAVLARESAEALKAERLAAARAVRWGVSASVAEDQGAQTGDGSVRGHQVDRPRGDRALRSAAREKKRAGTLATGARRQAKKDTR